MQPLDARDVTFGDVTFHIGKMMPLEAKRVFMSHVRPLLRGALSADTGDSADGWQIMLAAITDAPQQHYDALAQALYRHIDYTAPLQPTPVPLLNNEALAFKDLDMVHILMLDVRAFTVNFLGSWAVLRSEFPQLSQVSAQLDTATSILSSQTQ